MKKFNNTKANLVFAPQPVGGELAIICSKIGDEITISPVANEIILNYFVQ